MATKKPNKPELREHWEQVCEMVEEGLTLRQIGKKLGCTSGAISKLANSDEVLGKRYLRAREISADAFEQKIIEAANSTTNLNYNARRLQIDTAKWIAGRRNQKRYGDKIQAEIDGTLTVHIDKVV